MNNMSNDVFSRRLRKLRLENKMTMEELGRKLGVNKSRISMWENKGTMPKKDILIKIAKLYNVSVDYILGNTGSHTPVINPIIVNINRGLEKLDDDDLNKAENVLKAVFGDVFDDSGIVKGERRQWIKA